MEAPEIPRLSSPSDVTIAVRLRPTALEQLVSGGVTVNGVMQLIPDEDGAYSICVWSTELPAELPDPIPGNAAAAAELKARS